VNKLKQRLFTNWNLLRMMRLGIGITLLVMGIQSKDWAVGLFSIFFLYQAVTNTSCCGAQGCYTPQNRETMDSVVPLQKETSEYEEIK